MGASTSTSNPSLEAQEQETLASASLALPLLRAAFSRSNGSLAEALSPPPAAFRSDSPPVPPRFHDLVARLGPAIASLFFSDVGPAGDAAGWLGFLRGFNRCCARVPASQSLALLLRVYAAACADAGAPCGLQFHPDEDGAGGEGKVVGELAPGEIAVLLWMCWVMAWSGSAPGVSGGQEGGGKGEPVLLPDVTHLVLSALVSAGAVADDAGVWGWEVSRGGKGVKVQEFTSWVLSTAAGLGNCLSRYVQERFRSCAADPVEERSVSTGNTSSCNPDVYLLTRGRAWAISLSLRNTLSEKFLSASVIGMDTEDLLYRSSVHGKGLSRFWSCVEGYKGPVLILLSAFSRSGGDNVDTDQRWGIGILTEEGLQNKDTFYGSSASLCSTYPIFRMLPPSGMTCAGHFLFTTADSSLRPYCASDLAGKEKNFIYCHLHPQIRVYEAKPKPVGLGFGGTIGNERIFLDEDFSKLTVRHHAVDKTYQHGSLIPNQGYLPVEASVLDVEVWGLGGEATRRQQDMYKKREDIFSEQRRKVDLKTFGNWEDSPEKMMMDMISDPNAVRREDR
uniref:TLDc domain-containing protein n=1 Tax=Oryza rufipogon TaxID=4529 RepID=A0A0E0PFA0_ORYRU